MVFARRRLITLSPIWGKSKAMNKVSRKLGRTFHVLSPTEQRKSHILFTHLSRLSVCLKPGGVLYATVVANGKSDRRRINNAQSVRL